MLQAGDGDRGRLTVRAEWADGADGSPDLLVHLAGEMDAESVGAFEQWVDALEEHGDPVILDLADVSFVDSRGLRALLVAHDRCEQLSLRNVQRNVRLAFEMTGVAHLLLEPTPQRPERGD
jgi:anti-anti-sigma factor